MVSLTLARADAASQVRAPAVAIIIDDLGYKKALGGEIAALPWPLTVAVIPDTPHARYLAELAFRQGKEVMIHAPMETSDQRPWETGLNNTLSESAFVARTEQMLNAIPHAVGLNNHGGSLLTTSQLHMSWLMRTLKARDLYFIDSRTNPNSVAAQVAGRYQLATASRNVFLDNSREPAAVMSQLATLEHIARQRGYAIGIGHPHPETLRALQVSLAAMHERGVQLVYVSELVNHLKLQRQTAKTTAHQR